VSGAWRVFRRELRGYLATPWVACVAIAFLLLTGLTFFITTDGTREATLRFWFPNLAFVLLVTLPVVTSRTLAEERRNRHLDLLLTRPVDPLGIVVGKWLAVSALFVAFLVPTLVYAGFLGAWGQPDWPPLVASYAGAILSIGLFSAVGTLMSAATPTSVAAGLASFAVLVMLQLANSLPVFRSVSFEDHLDSFARGAPRLSDILYFGSGTVLCLLLAASWETARTVLARARRIVLPGLMIGASVAANMAVIPVDKAFDVTSAGKYSLTPATRDVLRNFGKQALITSFDEAHTTRAKDTQLLLEQYHRAASKVRYNLLDFRRHQGEASQLGVSDNGQAVVQVGERREVVDPPIELYITSALQRLARARPQTVCATTGHGEKVLDDDGPAGFDHARDAIEANGVTTRSVDLTVDQTIPPDCTIVALFGPRTPLRAPEVAALLQYLKNDGKMLVLRDPEGPDLDDLTAPYGLRLLPGVVVDPKRGVASDPRALVVNRFPTEAPIVNDVNAAVFVTAGGVTTAASEEEGLTVAKVLESSEAGWLELDPTTGRYEPEKGDRGGPIVMGGAADLSKLAPGESRVPTGGPSIARTRLLVIADVDWATNYLLPELDNRKLLGNAVNWLAGEENLVAVRGDDPDLRRLVLTAHNRAVMGWVSIGGLPGLAVVYGAGLWFKRRRQ
jgi:ABC-type transport system involved in multi-copper enzyme maturation permease subunit/ABC-type uncharacterized transport system involved in gliding motility auxiliary subunit